MEQTNAWLIELPVLCYLYSCFWVLSDFITSDAAAKGQEPVVLAGPMGKEPLI